MTSTRDRVAPRLVQRAVRRSATEHDVQAAAAMVIGLGGCHRQDEKEKTDRSQLRRDERNRRRDPRAISNEERCRSETSCFYISGLKACERGKGGASQDAS